MGEPNRSSHKLLSQNLSRHTYGVEKQSVTFFVKQFILRLFLSNVNCPLGISPYVFFVSPQKHKNLLDVFIQLFWKLVFHIRCLFFNLLMTCRAKVQAKGSHVTSVSRYAVALMPKEICFKVHFHHVCLAAHQIVFLSLWNVCS